MNNQVAAPQDKKNLVTKIAEKFSVEPSKFYDTLKATAFKQRDGSAPTNEQMMTLLIVADQYGLNPFTKEIYAFPDKQGGVVPVVGADGWIRIINDNHNLDGIEFEYSDNIVQPAGAKPCPEWIECIIYRKDRTRPVRVKEFLDETYRTSKYPSPWQTHTKRMLRHKALIQAARIAFGFTGIYDQDEAKDIIEKDISPVRESFANAISTKPKQPLDYKLLEKVAERAIASNSWVAAQEYIEGRYAGDDLDVALDYLRGKQEEVASPQAESEVITAEGEVV